MKSSSILLCLALAAAPIAAFAQSAPPPGPPPADGTPSPQMFAAMQQTHAQLEAVRTQARSRMLAALTPAHRTMLASIVGQLTLSATPNPRAAAAQLDAAFLPAEKQSIVAIDAAEHQSARSIMEQQRAAFESSLTADQRAQMADRKAKMDAFRQSHPRPAHVADPGMIALRTLGNFGGEERGFDHRGPGMPGA